MAVV
jgi:hypothetical protein